DDIGIAILPLTTSVAAWLNALGLYVLLARRRYFRVEGWLALRLAKQLVAALAMGATIWLVGRVLGGYFSGSVGQRMIGTVALIGAGSLVYFALAWITGGMDKEDLLVLLRRKRVEDE
ncbi:MAG TPA: murein biosynthesis integral membrane protein MurJ, partial [Sphingomicrobium sp.]|nr:murein biosynthesis integral membrane protein MurJ [Sphingomicrobium sp.]